jgi:hypothetical protein
MNVKRSGRLVTMVEDLEIEKTETVRKLYARTQLVFGATSAWPTIRQEF